MFVVEKTLEILDDIIRYQHSAQQSDQGDAIRMGAKAIRILAFGKSHRLDDLSLKLLLDAERRSNEE
ncbi:hypothetical protein LCGC14_0921780 [marine sediment metagenome]|uniref:Uncharacterized protein n=1 Tax=marine sediment metagenome TaxID=412755 RepID=A0A0F9RXB3_9ZZZZ